LRETKIPQASKEKDGREAVGQRMNGYLQSFHAAGTVLSGRGKGLPMFSGKRVGDEG